jgi:hypothetical protein
VLGAYGHLSNDQAAEAVRLVMRGSSPGSLRHLVQLHLSRECNRPALAAETGRAALAAASSKAAITTAKQHSPSRMIPLDEVTKRLRPIAM